MDHSRVDRALAGAGAVLLALIALGGLAFAQFGGLVSAQAPDPFVADGDPCCGHPDTWGEVASGVAWTFAYVVVAGLLAAGAFALLRWSTTGAWPRLRRLALIPVGAVVLAAAIFAVVLVPLLDEGRDLPECDSFAFREADWRAAGEDARLATAWGIAECGTFRGATRAEVVAALGKPSTEGQPDHRTYLGYAGLTVFLVDDRVVGANAGY